MDLLKKSPDNLPNKISTSSICTVNKTKKSISFSQMMDYFLGVNPKPKIFFVKSP